jgi:hypothetical protein
VFLPSGYATQERLIPRLLDEQLRIGKERFTLKDVHERHFLVNVQRDGKFDVSRLPRCPDCTTYQKREDRKRQQTQQPSS